MDAQVRLLNNESSKENQPKNIKLTLKPHQLTSLYQLCQLDRYCGITFDNMKISNNIGIYADIVGYGKTITFLSMISVLKNKSTHWMPVNNILNSASYSILLSKNVGNINCIETSLIVVPNNLVSQWSNHIDNYTDLSCEVITKDNMTKISSEEYDIIVCPASLYNDFIRLNNNYYWNRVAFDEADTINIPNTQFVKARFLWVITGTFANLPNRYNRGFLKDLFNTANRSLYNIVVIKCSEDYTKQSFVLPESIVKIIECDTPVAISVLNNYIADEAYKLLKNNDINGAILALGGHLDTDTNILKIVTRNIDNKLIEYNGKLSIINTLDISSEEKIAKIEKVRSKINQLEDKKNSIRLSILNYDKSICTICYSEITEPCILNCCKQLFCSNCIVNWLTLKPNQTCPLCRTNVSSDMIYKFGEQIPIKIKLPSKNDTVIKILLESSSDNKFILYYSKGLVVELIDLFNQNNISYIYFKYSIEKTLDKFKNDNKILLIDVENNFAGIEIEWATDVIIYNQLSQSIETQAIGRCQRIGRIKPLTIWKLKYNNEYI
jgi:hypothetical protein